MPWVVLMLFGSHYAGRRDSAREGLESTEQADRIEVELPLARPGVKRFRPACRPSGQAVEPRGSRAACVQVSGCDADRAVVVRAGRGLGRAVVRTRHEVGQQQASNASLCGLSANLTRTAQVISQAGWDLIYVAGLGQEQVAIPGKLHHGSTRTAVPGVGHGSAAR